MRRGLLIRMVLGEALALPRMSLRKRSTAPFHGSSSPTGCRPCSPASPTRDWSNGGCAPQGTRRSIPTIGAAFRTRSSWPRSTRASPTFETASTKGPTTPPSRPGFFAPIGRRDWGLPLGIPIAIGEFDVHYGAIGCGVREGALVKVIGTSTCDCAVVSAEKPIADIPGICGIVKGAILPGFFGIEAGQSAVGDIFKWWVEVRPRRRRGASRRADRRGCEATTRAKPAFSPSTGTTAIGPFSSTSGSPACCSARTFIRRGRTSIAP